MPFISRGWAQGAQDRTCHAVLVAVTDYPNLPKGAALVGPKNDAELVYRYLTSQAPVPFATENVALLAEGLADAVSPTRAAILAALSNVAARVGQGDFVYLHFSGHGAQQPERVEGNEQDGLDEIFLPADTKPWADKASGVPNALDDGEIGEALAAIRARGAFVWCVFDCCHSGTITRAASVVDDAVTERRIDPATLGVPETSVPASRGSPGQTPRIDRLGGPAERSAGNVTPGGMVAFFAAQTVETTPEMRLPKGAEDARKYGLFTYTLMSLLAQEPRISYRQLAQSVLQTYAGTNRSKPTPLFEGELDAPVFGSDAGDFVPQWPLTVSDLRATIPAGDLHRLSAGSRLAVLPAPNSRDDAVLGYVEVRSASTLSAIVAPVAFEGIAAPVLADLPAGAYARLVERAVDFEIVVARPETLPDLQAETALVNETLDALATGEDSAFRIRVVEPGSSADLKLAVMSEKAVAGLVGGASEDAQPLLWLLPSTAEISLVPGQRPPSIEVHMDRAEALAARLDESLTIIYRATNLSRLASASTFRADEVALNFRLVRVTAGGEQPLLPAEVPRAVPGDQIFLAASNRTKGPVDLNILFVGSDFSISHMLKTRLHPEDALRDDGVLEFDDKSFGRERMVAVLTEALPQTPVEDLSFLAQNGLPERTRAVGKVGLSALIAQMGGAPATRAAVKFGSARKGGDGGAVMIFELDTIPVA